MALLRRVLPGVAFAWLLCQSATLALAPASLWPGSADELLECTCGHGEHAVCPMHHKPAPGSTICLMGRAHDNTTAVLTSLFAGAGPLPAPPAPSAPDARPAIVIAEDTTRSLRQAPPDPPPPRA
jgi:hypothetical protein